VILKENFRYGGLRNLPDLQERADNAIRVHWGITRKAEESSENNRGINY